MSSGAQQTIARLWDLHVTAIRDTSPAIQVETQDRKSSRIIQIFSIRG